MAETTSIERDALVLADEWDALAERSGAAPFLRPGWMLAWSRAFAAGAPLEAIAVRREGRLAGVLPLVRHGRRLSAPANWHTPFFAPVAEDEEAVAALLRALLADGGMSAELTLVDPERGTVSQLRRAAADAGWRVLARPLTSPPYVALDGTWEEYERGLSKNRRKDLRKKARRLAEHGSVEVEVSDGGDGLAERLDEVFAVEGSGWKDRRGTAIASSEATRRFYTEVAEWAADRGWLRLAALRLDGRAVAVDYALVHDGVWYAIKGGYRPEHAVYGPGALLLHATVERAFADGLRRFELLGEADPFKLHWATGQAERWWLKAFAPTARGRVRHAAEGARERVRPVVRAVRGRT